MPTVGYARIILAVVGKIQAALHGKTALSRGTSKNVPSAGSRTKAVATLGLLVGFMRSSRNLLLLLVLPETEATTEMGATMASLTTTELARKRNSERDVE